MADQHLDKATPRPWRANTFAIYGSGRDGYTESAAHTGGCARSNEQRIANAELIVEAVNSFDTLRTQNEKLRELLKEVLASGVEYDDPRIRYTVMQVDNQTLKDIREALKEVE